MSESYFNFQTQLFAYHAYDFKQDHAVLITLDPSDNTSQILVHSNKFDYNVYGFGFIQPNSLIALWQFSIRTPVVCIQIDERIGKQRQYVTITLEDIRIAQDYKPFFMDFEKRLFYVLSCADNLSVTCISKINIDNLQLIMTIVQGQIIKHYIFIKYI
ncbi:unnamed protein product [Rotaria sordida]|uniref:Uncharacterized protein n=1 Tax=Rotaria sordida TaxID=392033 RepID=A0A814QQV5_9BILA|nr:unnamed protein product [Rotaria sordida]CAF1123174.1 unnamed protein product [Rotaria sordida]CAF1144830.1 unnamed protein product [Rotaria sordida]CAF3598186.1 unnamed protein product [Rotaria sordida]CAF3621800.1 unnamed protein product [Rotaria sordida]